MPPANDNLASASTLTLNGGSNAVDLSTATPETGIGALDSTELGLAYTGFPDVWFKFQAAYNGTVYFNGSGTTSGDRPYLEVFTDDASPTVGTLVRVDPGGRFANGRTPKQYSVQIESGSWYYVYAGSNSGTGDSYSFTALGVALDDSKGSTFVSVGFDDGPLVGHPTWTQINPDYKLASVEIQRGRVYETDRIDTGRATITLIDTNGDFDPMNVSGAFYGKTIPGRQAKIELQNPVNGDVTTVFRGHVERWRFEPHVTENFSTVTLELVDGLALLAKIQLTDYFGLTDGNIEVAADTALDAVRTRITEWLTRVGWYGSGSYGTLRKINSGNVGLLRAVYSPRTSVLSIFQDAADAEFPTVANFYMAKDGKATFHGRYPRFNPADVNYGIQTWAVGDRSEALADPTNVVPLSPPFVYYVDDTQLFTEAMAMPQGIVDGDMPGQYVNDSAAIDAHGNLTWTAEDLLTGNGSGPTTANAETLLFATYVVDNYKDPTVRVESLRFRPQAPSGTFGAATWRLLCGVELNDIVSLSTNHVGGGGFVDAEFFVEGIRYEIVPMASGVDEVTLTLDVSPKSLYASNPFAGP